MKSLKNKSRSGFTIVEAMVAMALLAIIAAGFLPAFRVISQSSLISDKITQASVLATNTMEELCSKSQDKTYAQIRSAIVNDMGFVLQNSSEPYKYTKANGGFTVNLSISGSVPSLPEVKNSAYVKIEVLSGKTAKPAAMEQTIINFAD